MENYKIDNVIQTITDLRKSEYSKGFFKVKTGGLGFQPSLFLENFFNLLGLFGKKNPKPSKKKKNQNLPQKISGYAPESKHVVKSSSSATVP